MRNKINIKSLVTGSLLAAAITMLCSVTCQADPPATPPTPAPSTLPQITVAKEEPVNYIIRVQWNDTKGTTNLLQVVIAEGEFKTDTVQLHPVKINNADIPVIVTLNGQFTVLSPEKGRLYLNLGKKTPLVTSTGVTKGTNSPGQSYQYISVGLNSNFVVTFGKPLVIQSDENGEISLLVKREES